MIKAYISYLFSAKDEHSLHSPFLFELYTKIIKNKGQNVDYQPIEQLRKQLKKDNRLITITDFGAGSKRNSSNERLISSIAKNAEKAPKFGQLLHRLIEHFQYKSIFDLGTSLGITTAYLATQNTGQTRSVKITTFEGCPETAKIAKENFGKLGLKNIGLIIGNLDETLAKKVSEVDKLDFVFFDANHRFEPTISYFETCLQKIHDDSLFVFDDIYWSKEMTDAWQYIKNHPQVTVTIDLFFVGLVFFRKKQPKQHFVLKF